MAGKIRTFRDLLVWQKSMALVTDVYRSTASFPLEERYGLTAQLRRCAVSIPSNIAEGFGRKSTTDYLRFLAIANGSLYEIQTQIEIAHRLVYLDRQGFDDMYEGSREVERMISSLMRRLRNKT